MANHATQYQCGGCGRLHGWHCPYYGHPGMKMTDEERASATARLETDKKVGNWPFVKAAEPRPLPQYMS